MFYYIPLLYLFKTRLKGVFSKLAWFSTYLIPVGITLYLLGEIHFGLYLLVVLTTFSSYELGYIYNDLELTKREKNPTIRVSEEDAFYYEKNKWKIYISRMIILSLLLFLSYIIFPRDFVYLLLNSIIILCVYVIYNSIRNEFNIFLYSILLTFKYFGFIILKHNHFELISVLWLLYPFCSTIDFASKKRFFTSKYIKMKDFDKFRFYYYFIINGVICLFFNNSIFYWLYIYLGMYLFIYRAIIYFFLSKKLR